MDKYLYGRGESQRGWERFRREQVAEGRSAHHGNKVGAAKARALAVARFQREHWGGRTPEAMAGQIRQAAKDASICAVCATPLAPGQSVTLTWWDIGERWPIWKRAPLCITCTLSDIQPKPWPYSDVDHPEYEHEGWQRFRCQGCGRPVRVAKTIRRVTSSTCCEDCERLARNKRNAERRRVVHEPIECAVCRKSFVPTRSDATTCSNRCRQAAHRQRAQAPKRKRKARRSGAR